MSKPPSKPSSPDIAVALGYNADTEQAPRILASARGNIAKHIIEIAKTHQIDIHQDKDLAEILSVLEIDSVIPIEAYAAVAEILAYIYKKKGVTL